MRVSAALMASAMSLGMLAGTTIAFQISRSIAGTPASGSAGTLGASGVRAAEVTATALMVPACACARAKPIGRLAMWMSPPFIALMTAGAPLKGTWTASKPARSLSISLPRWVPEPMPTEP